MDSAARPVLILGAGINGCALARELALNGISVWLVDQGDVAGGATSGSSRLIHGGLRYLEYGELDLVKESLAERTRLLRLAPQFVVPLKLWVPAVSRFGGGLAAVGRFFNWKHWPTPKGSRGSALVRAGLIFYDKYARDPSLPRHQCMPAKAPHAPPIDTHKYRRVCSYYDAQVAFPERLVMSMLEDARQLSAQAGLDFRVLTHSQARLVGDTVEITPLAVAGIVSNCQVRPAAIVNATGAWVDDTLAQLKVPADRLMGGTKGSHFFSFNPRLLEQLDEGGIYAEADDGRPIFILPVVTPLARWALVGTTDLPYAGKPEDAVATPAELEYLVRTVNSVLPEARLTIDDVDFHYSAVRPLPYVNSKTTAAITRRHSLVDHESSSLPMISIVGGKLTTMRSLAEEAAAKVLSKIGRQPTANSENRPFPGAADFPQSPADQERQWTSIAADSGFEPRVVRALWSLCGSEVRSILCAATDRELLVDTDLPLVMVRRAIQQEYAHSLPDLVERRLMLLYHQRLTRACLAQLARQLVAAGHLSPERAARAVDQEIARLRAHFGKRVD